MKPIIPWVTAIGVLAFLLFVWPAWAFDDGKPFWDHLGETKTVYVNQDSSKRQPNDNGGTQANTASCRVIHDYQLQDLHEVATSGSHLHAEYWWDGQPERETLIPASAADGGRFILARPLKGHVWEYADCTDQEVLDQINAHIGRRLAGHANNAGYFEWKSTGLFLPSGKSSIAPSAPAPAAPAPQRPVSQSAPAAPSAPPAEGCPGAREMTYATPTDVTITGPAVVHPWWNNGSVSFGQAQVRVMFESGQTATLVGMMGKTWTYNNTPACIAALPKEFNNASFPVKTLGELGAAVR